MWEISNNNQITTFLLSMVIGGFFCLIYDVVRAVRKVGFNTTFIVNVTDILIWIIYAFITFMFFISRTNGEIRGYALVGEIIGFGFARITISKIWFVLLKFFFVKIAYVKRKIMARVYLIFDNIEIRILKRLKYAPKLLKSVKKFLKNTGALLYNKINIVDKKRSLNETKT
ncbi:MAG: spore cortex biosynthesis protein YabQ [Clostridia bacterium]|nr:spore cortex biosynthesis protein YabQ [Clostridia bacterium]